MQWRGDSDLMEKTINRQELKNWLVEHPDYIETIRDLIDWEEENKGHKDWAVEDDPFDTCWEYSDVSHHPSHLYQLEANGFLERVLDTNSTTAYSLIDRDAMKEVVGSISIGNDDGMRTVIHDFPDDEEDLDGAFDKVVGYNDVKWLMKRAITTQEITNVLLIGPPGSAKTVFLMCIEDLGGGKFISGKPTSGPGVLDIMFDETPKYMLIDEMDDMDAGVQQVLSQYTETGIVDETKIGKNRKLKTNTKTFGSANDLNGIIGQVQDRFLDLHFEPYTRDEFIEVCEHVLEMEENVSEEEANTIASGVWDIEESGDVRKAIQVARLSRGDPDKVLEVLKRYSGNRPDELFGL